MKKYEIANGDREERAVRTREIRVFLGALNRFFAARSLRSLALAATLFASLAGTATPSQAGFFDYTLGFNFNRSEFANESYSWTRRYGTSLGYHFTEQTTLEASFQDSYDRNHYTGYEDSTYHDRVYSLNWVQGLTGKEAILQPYVKIGIGLLNRDAKITDGFGRSQTSRTDNITGVIGAGLRVRVTQTVGLRVEGTSYLSGGKLSSWGDNFAATFGASIYF